MCRFRVTDNIVVAVDNVLKSHVMKLLLSLFTFYRSLFLHFKLILVLQINYNYRQANKHNNNNERGYSET